MRRNIYVKESDEPLFKWAEKQAGENLSSILAAALKLYKEKKGREARLNAEIKVVDSGLILPGNRKQFHFNLVRKGRDTVTIWSDTGADEYDANIQMTKNALQTAYDLGFDDGIEVG